MFIQMLFSENLKYKRTFAKKLSLIAPAFFILYAILSLNSFNTEYNYFEYTVFNWWPFIFVPLIISIISSLSIQREKKYGTYRILKIHSINMFKMYSSKVLIIGFYVLISTIILIITLLLVKLFIPSSISSVTLIFKANLIICFTSLSLIPINLFFAEKLGMIASLIINFIGMFSGVIMAPENIWLLNPWSWSLRLLCPIVKVHPNGVPLGINSELLNSNVIFPGITISIISFVILTILITIWFVKREVH
ncbi:MAG: lantibiotic immunity ABC transporter MutE/EpiE family permease subunit [Clostridiales bacterium]